MRAPAFVAVAVATLGCGNPSPPPPPPPPAHPVASAVASAPPVMPAAPVKASIGDACEPGAVNPCGEGTRCLPGKGGYCSRSCAVEACGAGTSCIPTGQLGEICAKSCTKKEDCREGWSCDPTWSVCTQPTLPAPKFATCSAPALSRKTFGTPKQITTYEMGGYNFEPAAALNKKGELAIAFMAGTTSRIYGIRTLVVDATGKVDASTVLSSGKETHFDPWMASSPKTKKLSLVWLGYEGTKAPEKNAEIGFATSDDGRSWSPSHKADDHAQDCKGKDGCYDKPMVVIGPDKARPGQEATYVFYLTETGEGLKLVKSIDGGATFSPSVMVREDGGWGGVELTASGVLSVAHMRATERIDGFGDKKTVIELARSEDGGKTFVTSVVSEPGQPIPMFFANPQIVSDEARKLLYVVYPTGARDGRWDLVLATSKDAGKTWSRIKVNDDASCANHAGPQAVIDPKTGRVHVTWLENRTGKGGVAYASCDPGGAKCTANEAVSTPFASYVLTRHSPKWMGEYGTLLFEADKRRLHSVWTQTVDESGQPTARIFYATAQL